MKLYAALAEAMAQAEADFPRLPGKEVGADARPAPDPDPHPENPYVGPKEIAHLCAVCDSVGLPPEDLGRWLRRRGTRGRRFIRVGSVPSIRDAILNGLVREELYGGHRGEE